MTQASKYGIQEHMFPEKDILEYYKHPFLLHISKLPEIPKMKAKDGVDQIEKVLSAVEEHAGQSKGSLAELVLSEMKSKAPNPKKLSYNISQMCTLIQTLVEKGDKYGKGIGKLLGIGGQKKINEMRLQSFIEFKNFLKKLINEPILSHKSITNSEISISQLEELFDNPHSSFFRKSEKFKDVIIKNFSKEKGINTSTVKPGIKMDNNYPFLVSLITRVKEGNFDDYRGFLEEIFDTIGFKDKETSDDFGKKNNFESNFKCPGEAQWSISTNIF